MDLELKATLDTLSNAIGDLPIRIKRLEEVTEKNQSVIDNYIAKRQAVPLGNSSRNGLSFKASIENALSLNEQKIYSYITGEKSNPLSIEVKDMSLASNYSGGTSAITMKPSQIVSTLDSFTHVRDVLPKTTMTTGAMPIIKSNGNVGDFAMVEEGGTKPSVDFSLAEQPAKAEVLAAITVVTRQFLDDLGTVGVQNWIIDQLTELYLIAEDNQLLNGSGVSPNLKGINSSGNFTTSSSFSINPVIRLIESILQMRTARRTPKAIIIHPANIGTIILNQSSGSGEFDLPSIVTLNNNGGLSILGVPVIDTIAQTEDRFNILDTSGMQMGIRENLNIRFFESDKDNVRTNKITVRAEARIAFANHSATNVIQGSFVQS